MDKKKLLQLVTLYRNTLGNIFPCEINEMGSVSSYKAFPRRQKQKFETCLENIVGGGVPMCRSASVENSPKLNSHK